MDETGPVNHSAEIKQVSKAQMSKRMGDKLADASAQLSIVFFINPSTAIPSVPIRAEQPIKVPYVDQLQNLTRVDIHNIVISDPIQTFWSLAEMLMR